MIKLYAICGTLKAKTDRCKIEFRLKPTVYPSTVTVPAMSKSDDEDGDPLWIWLAWTLHEVETARHGSRSQLTSRAALH